MTPPNARSTALVRLGFTQLESDIYAVLTGRGSLTPYAVARTLGRPTANVYKAVEALVRKGAVLVEDGRKRECRAVPPELLLTRIEQTVQTDVQMARELFAQPDPSLADERVYRLETPGEVISRCTEMLARAERIAVVDAFPAALGTVATAVTAAAARGVRVHVEAYAPSDLPGADVIVIEHGPLTRRRWRSEQLNVVVDGREHVAALLSEDLSQVYQAIWSDSLYLSCLMHAGRVSEHTLIKLMRMKRTPGVPAAMKRILEEHPFFANSQVPGLAEIVQRLSGNVPVPDAATPQKRRRQ